jgi:serine/threonine protein kinase
MENELDILQKTDHPHIAKVFDLLKDSKHYYVVMEYLPDGDLYSRIGKIKKFTEDHAAMVTH